MPISLTPLAALDFTYLVAFGLLAFYILPSPFVSNRERGLYCALLTVLGVVAVLCL